MDFQESGVTSSYSASRGELTITVIKPGLSKNDRVYPAAVLKSSVGIFEGAKMFADHQTERQQKDQPEGSVNNWVATLKKVWAESDGTVKGVAVVIDPAFKSKLDRLNEAGMLNRMGVSIRAIGTAVDGEQDGRDVKIVESLVACRSVDFVTYAGAGGAVESMAESAKRIPTVTGVTRKPVTEAEMRESELALARSLGLTARETELFLEAKHIGVDQGFLAAMEFASKAGK